MPQNKKYNDEFRLTSFDMFCEGLSVSQIAKAMNVSNLVIKRLKNQKFPADWNKGRSERVLNKTKTIQEFKLKTLEQTLVDHQMILASILEKVAKALLKNIDSGKVDSRTLARIFFKGLEAELKLFVPLDRLYPPR